MNKLPNLRHLQYLIALYQTKNFHRAAEACFVSQSTLSSAIIKLEEQLGGQLIERDQKSFIFTALGKQVVEKSEELITQAKELVEFSSNHGEVAHGSINLGSIPTIAPFFLTTLMNTVKKEMPKLSVFVNEDTTENLLKKLHTGELDVLLLALPIDDNAFRSEVVGPDPFFQVGYLPLIEQLNKTGNLNVLPSNSIFLLSSEHCLTGHTISACKLANKAKIHPFFATSLSTLLQMTKFHQGVTYLPKMAIDSGIVDLAGLTVAPVVNNPYREIGLVWRKTSMRQQTYMKLGSLLKPFLKN